MARAAADPAAALARAAEAGIHRIPVATPFAVGEVNTYLIEDDPLTLVDTGPNWGVSLDALAVGIEALGHRVADLGLIVLSHQHTDHVGLAGILARRSGADVVAFELIRPWMTDYPEQARAENEFAVAVMKAHGVPEAMWTMLPQIVGVYRMLGAPSEVSRGLLDSDEICLRDRTLRVAHRPGHSPGDLIFADAASAIVLSADHLIGHISSNPLLMRPLDGAEQERTDGAVARPHQLAAYVDSMRATRAMDGVEVFLPGHGDPVCDHVTLIDDRLRMHERRKEKILGILERAEDAPWTAHGIARAMWGDVALTQVYLTLSEVLGHVDLLVADGRVAEHDEGGLVRLSVA